MNRSCRVGFVCQWYAAEPGTLPTEFAHGLQDAGWNVRVLTGFPNYPSGKVHEGYANRLPQKETIDGVPVLRTPLYPSHDRSAVRRILNYLTWSTSATLAAASWLAGSDVCLVYGSPLTAAAPAVALKWLRGTPYVIQVQDLWPDSIVESGFSSPLPGAVRRALERICNRIYAEAAECVVWAGVTISTNVTLGRHVQVHANPNATIGHGSVISDFVNSAPRHLRRDHCQWGESRRSCRHHSGGADHR